MAGSVSHDSHSRRTMRYAALCGLLLAAWGLTAQVGGAQAPQDDPTAAFTAARGVLATELGVPHEVITLARAEPVTWTDGCLGLATGGEFCTQALVEGWTLWLRGPDALYRLHTDAAGTAIRSAGAVELAGSIPELPLPEGATLRLHAPPPAPSGTAGIVRPPSTSPTLVGLLLAAAGAVLVFARWVGGRAAPGEGDR